MGLWSGLGARAGGFVRAALGVFTAELGAPGTRVSGGRIATEEHVPELQGARLFDVYEKMRRSDPTVKAALLAMKLPLLSAEWDIAPGSDAKAATGPQIAEHLARNFFEGMSISWGEHLWNTLTHLDFGFAICEHTWRAVERGGQLWWEIRKLAPRLQRTITHWELAEDGGLIEVHQRIYGAPSGRLAKIPIDRLLVFSHQKEGANWTGTSALRAAYKPWWLKDEKERYQAIQAERHALGIPVMSLPAGKDDDANIKRAEEIVFGVRTHERAGVVEPFGYKFRFEGAGESRLLDMLPQLNYHDRQIALSVLAHFLALGGSGEGSNALSEDQTSFFLLAEKAIAQHILDVHNRYLIPHWVAVNYGEVEQLPQLRVGRIETRALEKLWNAMGAAAGQMLITPDDRLEDAMRKDAGMPARDPSTARKRAKPDPAPRPQPAGEPPGTPPPPAPEGDDEDEEED